MYKEVLELATVSSISTCTYTRWWPDKRNFISTGRQFFKFVTGERKKNTGVIERERE
jgi:hypothetical protein